MKKLILLVVLFLMLGCASYIKYYDYVGMAKIKGETIYGGMTTGKVLELIGEPDFAKNQTVMTDEGTSTNPNYSFDTVTMWYYIVTERQGWKEWYTLYLDGDSIKNIQKVAYPPGVKLRGKNPFQ